MTVNIKEIGFEEFIEKELFGLHGFVVRKPSNYNIELALDKEMVLKFWKKTQPDMIEKLKEVHGGIFQDKILERLDLELEKRGTLEVLRKGINDRGVNLNLAYFEPQSTHNPEAINLYKSNIFSVIRQVHYSTKNTGKSIDMVLFVNGIPVFTVELKNQLTGQSVFNSMNQYRDDRDPKEKLLKFKRVLACFGVDTEEVVMTTKLQGRRTRFLPFNKGFKEGRGNPVNPNGYKSSYIWEDLWSPQNILELISQFITLTKEEKEDERGRQYIEENIIFPRYHQRDTVKKLIADAKENGTGKNYLIEHSAGSGKSNTISWTAHRLSELHGKDAKSLFDGVIILTDRKILDKQLSSTVEQFSQVRGVVRHVESGAELKEALEKGERIIVSTLQKFPVISKTVMELAGKKFAVIIDEAHSSQSGESAKHVRQTLNAEDLDEAEKQESKEPETLEDFLNREMQARKITNPNISYFAFTATPKQKTMEIFGEKQPDDTFKPFSLYSMRQAIEEGFILDVLQNYTTYRSYFEILAKFKDRDEAFEKKAAQRLLLGFVDKHEHAIRQKTKIMVEHFHAQIAHLINGKAKAMIVTKSRLHAVRFKQAFDKYLEEQGLPYKALVAFSGTVKDARLEFTETGMNKFSEKNTAEEFKKSHNRFLIAANKFQTGFDQPLLSAMYVDKLLSGVNAVQTLSRLNRTHPYKDEVIVLDFVNETDEIQKSFQPYYTTTILSKATDPNLLYDLSNEIYSFKAFTTSEVDNIVEIFYKDKNPDRLNSSLDFVIERIEKHLPEEKNEFIAKINDFLKLYSFLSQIITFADTDLEKLHIYLRLLKKKIKPDKETVPKELLEAVNFASYKLSQISHGKIHLDNEDKLLEPMSGYGSKKQEKIYDKLSNILNDVNKRYGTNFTDEDRVILRNLSYRLEQDSALEGSIKSNSRETAKVKFEQAFERELIKIYRDHFNFYKKVNGNNESKSHIMEKMFASLYKREDPIETEISIYK